jgi:uncharacterized repeat protein (TIGR01451 family)
MSKETTKMRNSITARRRSRLGLLAGLALLAILVLAPASPAAADVKWDVKTTWGETEMRPGSTAMMAVTIWNAGTTTALGQVKVEDHLPQGVTVKEAFDEEGWVCFGSTTLICKAPLELGEWRADVSGSLGNATHRIQFLVSVSPEASGVHNNVATVTGAGATNSDTDPIHFGPGEGQFGLIPSSVEGDTYSVERPDAVVEHQAGSHPFEQRVNFDFNQLYGNDPFNNAPPYSHFTKSIGRVRTVETILPRGMIGNAEGLPKCRGTDLLGAGSEFFQTAGCPADTQVGYLKVQLSNGFGDGGWGFLNEIPRVTVYNMVPPKGVAADFGFKIGQIYIGHIYITLDPAHDYAIKATAPYITDLEIVRGVQLTLWGVPGDPAHDRYRAFKPTFNEEGEIDETEPFGASVGGPYRAFLDLPMDCAFDNGPFLLSVDSWNHPGVFTNPMPGLTDLNVTGCDDPRVRFKPQINLQPTSRDAGSPTGLDVHLEVPQRSQVVEHANELYSGSGSIHGVDTPPMKKVVVTFPPDMTISTSAAQGLGVCSSAQLALGTNKPVTCPDNSQYGQLTLHTPILPPDQPMRGFIYIAKKDDNPYHNFLSMYFVIQEPERDLLIKIPGKIDLDPVTGQIKVTFDDLPQFPLSDMQLTFKGGVRSALVNPRTCGNKQITATFYSWADPETPHTVSSSYDITHKADGSPCVQSLVGRPFDVQMSAGTVNPNAASYSPFLFRMTRTDDDQEISQIGTDMPPGLTARIAGTTICPDEAIERAANPFRTGTEERDFPSCPASSFIGQTDVGSGVGVPLSFFPGRLYLAGPYKGAPLSFVVITPAMPGPYDLGVIVVRTAVRVDPESTAIHVLSDPFPQIYQGIPVRIRDIRLKIDKPDLMKNPTSCAPMSIDAHLTGAGGDVNTTADDTASNLSTTFQVANCSRLDFRPKLRFKLKGGTGRSDHPSLTANLTTREGDANMHRVSVTLPRSEFLDQGHINTICTRVQFRADECPIGSIYGYARAWTPLLDQPVEGPVYLRSSEHELPDIVMALHGLIDVDVVGRIDSVNGGIRTTFSSVPDQPVSKFSLTLKGGGKGLLVNSTNLCNAQEPAKVLIDGQNGKTADQLPRLTNTCGNGRKKRAKRHRHHRRSAPARKAG